MQRRSPCYAEYGLLRQSPIDIGSDILASDYAITNKLTPFISMQNHYNLLYREEEREMMPTLKVTSSPLPYLFNHC